jgi:hypothetical protein
VAGESRGLRLSTSTTTRFSVATEALRHALRSMRRLGGRIPGAAVWRLTEDGLEVEWKGGAHGLAIERLHGPAAAIRVASGVMISLAKNLPADGVVEVVIGPDEVRLRVATVREGGVTRGSTMVIPREDVGEGPTALLPVGAGDLQILMLGYQHDAEVIANAGLTDAVAERREKARGEHSTRRHHPGVAGHRREAPDPLGPRAPSGHHRRTRELPNRSRACGRRAARVVRVAASRALPALRNVRTG